MMKFPDLLEEVVKRIQNLLDKETEDQLIILNEMDEFRKMISRIVLAYMKIYHYCGYGFIESEISLKVS